MVSKKAFRFCTFAFVKKRFLCVLLLSLTGFAFADSMPALRTVFVFVLENHNWGDIVGNTNAPYINQVLLPVASHCEQYYNPPNNHPSLRNYLWMEAGTDFGITMNNSPAFFHQSTTNHLVNQLERAGISWKSYQEDIDGAQVPLNDVNAYAVRHNPMVYFDDVTGTNDPNYAYGISHVRPYSELARDLTNNTVARYNFITPNLCDDGHNTCEPLNNVLAQADTWLSTEIPRIMASAAYSNNGAIFITWDEGVGGDGPIGMIVLSPLARGRGYSNCIHYTHSSLLRSLQETFGVGPLLNDATNAVNLGDLFTQLSITGAARLPNGFQITMHGTVPGGIHVLESSSDLIHWIPVSTNMSGTNQWTTVDPGAMNLPQKFYRVRQVR